MELIKMIPNNSVNREDSSNSNKAAVCPESWSLVDGQVLLSPNNLSQPVASMKIFTSVMLHAWRRRRADVQRLQLVVDRLKTSSMQAKNELHVCSTRMRVEQKHCQNLQLELKKSTLSINQVRNSCEMLSTSVLSLTAEKKQLEQDLSQIRKECGELKQQATKSKDDLLAALLEQRNLQQLLSTEQRLVHQLTREKEQLLDDLNYLRNMQNEFQRKEESYLQELKLKEENLLNMSSLIQELQQQLNNQSRQWFPLINRQKFQGTDLSATQIGSRFHLMPFKNNLAEFIKCAVQFCEKWLYSYKNSSSEE